MQAAPCRSGCAGLHRAGQGTAGHVLLCLFGEWAAHLAGLLFARALAGVRMEHVPYKGNAESVRALLANEVQVYFASVSAGLEQVASGAKGIHVLTTAWPSRLPGYPDAPSAAESGVPGLNESNWWGLGAPSGTPLAVREIGGGGCSGA